MKTELVFFAFAYVWGVCTFLLVAALLDGPVRRLWPHRFHPRDPAAQGAREGALSALNLVIWAAAAPLLFWMHSTMSYPLPVNCGSDWERLLVSGFGIEDKAVNLACLNYKVSWAFFPLCFAALLVAADLAFATVHYVIHKPRWFAWVHATHHRFVKPTAYAGYAFHPYEGLLLTLLSVVLPYLLLPVSHRLCLVINVVTAAWGAFLHSGLRTESWRTHRWLRYLNSPDLHRRHHETGVGAYSLFFTWCDEILGTQPTGGPESVTTKAGS